MRNHTIHVWVRMRWYFLLLLMCLFTYASVRNVAGQTRDQELANTLLAGLRSHTEHLQSGVVDFEVRDGKGDVIKKYFVAFDDRAEKVRSDVDILSEERGVRIIHTKTEFLQFITRTDGGLLTRLNPGVKSEVSEGMPIDVRAIGLMAFHFVRRGGKAEDALKTFERTPLVSAVLEKDIGLVVLESHPSELGVPATHALLWIDTANDYAPVRMEMRLVSPLLGGSRVKQQVVTSWGRINKTWVPIRSIYRFFGLKDSPDAVSKEEEVRLTWRSVNEKVPETLFSEESLKLPKNTYIVNARLGTPVLEKVIGLDHPLPAVPTPHRMSSTRMVMVIVCAVLLLVLVAILILRHRGRLLRRS